MHRLTLKTKLWLTLGVLWVSILAICTWGAFHTRTVMLDERKASLKNVVDVATSVVRKYADTADNNAIAKADAQRKALALLRAIRFGKDGYVYVLDTHENVIMNPMKPELEGKNESGVEVFQEASELARAGGGYSSFLWPKPGHPQPVRKISRVGYFAPWDWCIISGLYVDDIDDAFRTTLMRWCALVLTLGGCISLVMLLIIRNIEASLGGEPGYAVDVANRIAEGDLAVHVRIRPSDANSLLASMRRMRESLSSAVDRIREGSESILAAAKQIAAGNSDLSVRTESQATALEETAASIAQLTQTVRQNADNAHRANTLAVTAAEMAGSGNDAVRGMVATVQKISDSSSAISEITALIEGIAFQTNILALNAAVEAARAGEHGRGFAVVAGEVRGLATRASTAAKEIKALIESSIILVRENARQAAEADATMKNVQQAIRKVSDIVGEISTASAEQSLGIEQVNEAVHQMDEMTQQNAALVEQAAASAHSMQEQAVGLAKTVSAFNLQNERNGSYSRQA